MSRNRIGELLAYSKVAYEKLPTSREIEDPEVDWVLEHNPKKKSVSQEPYIPDPELVEAVDIAIALGRPLLLQGDPGCGKTRLAYAVAYALGLPLEECYIKSTSRAQDLLYTYDAVNRLYDAQLRTVKTNAAGDSIALSKNIRKYIHLGPLGRAIVRAQYGRRSVVLIDEIDKADLDFPNDLLLELDRLEFRVTETSNMKYAVEDPELRPIVIVTHNEEKALPVAFLRRCVFHYVKFPENKELVKRILSIHDRDDEQLNEKAIEVLLRLRGLNLSKSPGLSELLDWVGYLQKMEKLPKELEQLPYLGVLLKQQIDLKSARKVYGIE